MDPGCPRPFCWCVQRCSAAQASLLYIFRSGIVIIGEKPAVAYMQSFAKTLVHMGYVQYHEARLLVALARCLRIRSQRFLPAEAASEEPLRKALQTYSELGIVRWAKRTGNQGDAWLPLLKRVTDV